MGESKHSVGRQSKPSPSVSLNLHGLLLASELSVARNSKCACISGSSQAALLRQVRATSLINVRWLLFDARHSYSILSALCRLGLELHIVCYVHTPSSLIITTASAPSSARFCAEIHTLEYRYDRSLLRSREDSQTHFFADASQSGEPRI